MSFLIPNYKNINKTPVNIPTPDNGSIKLVNKNHPKAYLYEFFSRVCMYVVSNERVKNLLALRPGRFAVIIFPLIEN